MNHDNEVLLQHTRFLMQNYALSKGLFTAKNEHFGSFVSYALSLRAVLI